MVRHIFCLFIKDLRIQMRSKNTLILMFVFSVLIVLIFCFAFGPIFTPIHISAEKKRVELAKLAGSMLWISFAFSGIIGLSRSFDIERNNNVIKSLRLTGIVPTNIYIAKVISNIFFLLIIEIMITPITLVFLGLLSYISIMELLELVGVFILGTFGFCSGGSLIAAITVKTDAKESLLTAILFPVLIPLLIAASKSTITILKSETLIQEKWLIWLAGYSLFLFGVSYLTFGYIIEK